jgi:hypothetical protein
MVIHTNERWSFEPVVYGYADKLLSLECSFDRVPIDHT